MFDYQVNVPQGSYGVPVRHTRGQGHPQGLAWSASVPMIWEVTLSANGSQLSLGAGAVVSTLEAANQRVELCRFVSVTS